MSTTTEVERIRLAQVTERRAMAERVLANVERAPNLFLLLVSITCNAGVFAFFAGHFGQSSQPVIAALAGAALSLALFSYGECARQRRRVEALLVLHRSSVV